MSRYRVLPYMHYDAMTGQGSVKGMPQRWRGIAGIGYWSDMSRVVMEVQHARAIIDKTLEAERELRYLRP